MKRNLISSKKLGSAFIILYSALFCLSCENEISNKEKNTAEQSTVEVREIKLTGDAAERKSEISGMSWCRDELILLPQYPFKTGNKNHGRLFKINKTRILNYVNNIDTSAIKPDYIIITGEGLERVNFYGQGYESIIVCENEVYLTIETKKDDEMSGYLIKGSIDKDISEIILDKNSLVRIEPQSPIDNLSEETIFEWENSIYTIYEANGKNINSFPVSHKFDRSLKNMREIRFQNIEFRITDASSPDENGIFWAINYMYKGDWKDLKPDLAEDFPNIAENKPFVVERLLQFRISDTLISRTSLPPVNIKILPDSDGTNWEGMAKLDNYGFLIVSDYFPKTRLGFIQYKID